MAAILKKNVLRSGNKESSGREGVDKLIDTIVTPHHAVEKQPKETAQECKQESQAVPLPIVTESKALQNLFSSEVVIDGEDGCAFDEIRTSLRNALRPTNDVEAILVDRIASSTWRLKRCLKFEKQIIELCSSDVQEYEQGFFRTRKRSDKELKQLKALKVMEGKSLAGELSSYESLLESQVYKALNTLNKMRRRVSTEERRTTKKGK
ncbi:MAG: hypothetical protein HW390_1545 [Candidatus Brocadiaceae bacterium]|nr:hypothetical protein [Candidatus Brocadiaceae bacterium]